MAHFRKRLANALSLVLLSALTTGALDAVVDSEELVAHYSKVTDWYSYSARFNITEDCAAGNGKRFAPLRWAYFTRHPGTLWDWIAVADHLNLMWTRVQNRNLWELVDHRAAPDTYTSTSAVAMAKWRGMGQLMCHMADVLVFGDVIPDARPVLEGNCTTPILLLVTNRFDVGVRGNHAGYYKLMAEVATRPWVWFAVNNPYDVLYMTFKGVRLPQERTFLVRPVGASFIAKPPPDSSAARQGLVALIEHAGKPHLEITTIIPWLKSEKLMSHVAILDKFYGGPVVLSHHKAVIQVPYQVSVMKMYESMAYGAVFIVPSPTFFSTLLSQYNQTQMSFCCRSWLQQYPDRWYEVVDWYHPDFIDGHVLFESWDDLKMILRGDGKYTPEFFAHKKAESQRLMLASRKRSLDGYKALVSKLIRQSCDFSKREDLWPPPYTAAWARKNSSLGHMTGWQ